MLSRQSPIKKGNVTYYEYIYMILNENFMRYILLIVLAFVIMASCKDDDPDLDFFDQASLVGDSINVLLRMNEPQIILTNEGEMSIYFIASELCPQDECSTCDVDASINILLVHKTDTVKVPSIRIYRCGQNIPILYKTIGCNQNDFGASGHNFAKYGKIIYNIKEMYPYPQTMEQLNDLIQNNLYYIRLTALNTCIK